MNKIEKINFAEKYLLGKENKYANYIYKESYFNKTFPEVYEEINKIQFPDDFKFSQKIWHFIYEDFDFDKRCNCSLHGKLKFLDFRRGYRSFCKPHCDEYNRVNAEKSKQTRIKNCGSVEKSYEVGLEKQRETCLKKYGVLNGGGTKESVNKIFETKRERYGSLKKLYDENKKKSDLTRINKYGSVQQSYELSVQKRKETLSQKDEEYIYNISQSVKKTKSERYGDETYNNHNKYKTTCLEKYGVDNYSKTDEFKCKNLEIKTKKTIEKYPEILYRNDSSFHCKCIDCQCTLCSKKEFDINYFTFFNRKNYNIDLCTIRTPEKEYNPTSGLEKSVDVFIKSVYSGKIIENDRKILKGKELDIYLPELNIAFEFNGIYWHNEFNKPRYYHQDKSLECKENGIQLIHIWEDDWLYRNDIVKDIIKSKLGLSDFNIGARKCEIRNVSNKDAIDFLNKYHIQGGVSNGKSIGLYYQNNLVEILTFGQLRKNMGSTPEDGKYEIYRVCSKAGYNIQGGFSRLLHFFETEYKPKEVITYGNLDYTYGNVYLKCGFIECGLSAPTYTWVVDGKRCHRSNFMKSKLDECKSNPELTECEVMHSRGCWRCWDAGKIKFIKTYERG